MKGILGIIFATCVSLQAGATVRSGLCPQEFIGKLKVVIENVGEVDSSYETNSFVFNNLETIRGEIPQEVILKILRTGPFHLIENQDYRVQIKNGRLCWIEPFENH